MYSSPWGRHQRQGPPPRLPPNDNRTDEDANRERVILLERDDRLGMAERKRQSFLNKLQLEARRKELAKGKVISMFFPSVGVNNLQMEDVNRALRVSGFCPRDIAGVKLNDFRTNQAEIMLTEETDFQIDEIEKKLKDANIYALVSVFEALEEVLVLYGLPLTNDIEGMKSMIAETISPFVKKVGNVFPCKYGATAGEFFEGKLNGNWRVKVNPRADRQVPNFIVIGPETKVMVKAKYVRNEYERKQMCSDCFSTEHFRLHEDCQGPRKWDDYCKEFSDHWEMCRLDTEESEDQQISRNEQDSRHIVLSRQLQKDLENMEQEKLLLETRLKDQNELLEKAEELEKDNKRLRLLGSLVGCRRRIRTNSASANIDHAPDCEEFALGINDRENGSLKCISVPEHEHERLASVTDPAFLSRSDAGSASEDSEEEIGLEYDHDYIGDPLNVTVVESEEAPIEPLINSWIAVKKTDGGKAYCVVLEKRPGENGNCLYVVKERDSDRQVEVDLNTIDWSPWREGNGKK